MGQQDLLSTTTTTTKADFRVQSVVPDSPTNKDETIWDVKDFATHFGAYTNHAKIKKPIDAFATWIIGGGFESDTPEDKVTLEHVTGNGDDDFLDVMWNALVMKKVAGDSFTHVVRDPKDKQFGRIVNMIPLNPLRMRMVFNGKGRIKRYEYYGEPAKEGTPVIYEPYEILHMCNDRVADEMHGRSIIEAALWNLEAQEEAKRVLRKLVWRSGVVRVIEVDTSNPTELAQLKAQYKTAEEKGDVLLLPKDKARAVDWKPNIDVPNILAWITYLENEFYILIGVPKVILGGTAENTEASAKVATLNFDPMYKKEINELQSDLWNQIGIKVIFNPQASLMDNAQQTETKNQSQLGFQANDTTAGSGKA